MASTVIIKCPFCAGLFLSGVMQKAKSCPYCGKNVKLKRALCVVQVASAMEASEVLKQLKAQNAKNVGPKFRSD